MDRGGDKEKTWEGYHVLSKAKITEHILADHRAHIPKANKNYCYVYRLYSANTIKHREQDKKKQPTIRITPTDKRVTITTINTIPIIVVNPEIIIAMATQHYTQTSKHHPTTKRGNIAAT
jgi:hypothetical protein